jgi:hypothetical protein
LARDVSRETGRGPRARRQPLRLAAQRRRSPGFSRPVAAPRPPGCLSPPGSPRRLGFSPGAAAEPPPGSPRALAPARLHAACRRQSRCFAPRTARRRVSSLPCSHGRQSSDSARRTAAPQAVLASRSPRRRKPRRLAAQRWQRSRRLFAARRRRLGAHGVSAPRIGPGACLPASRRAAGAGPHAVVAPQQGPRALSPLSRRAAHPRRGHGGRGVHERTHGAERSTARDQGSALPAERRPASVASRPAGFT